MKKGMTRPQKLKSLIIQTYKEWRKDRTMRIGAGLAYYGLFAIVPMLTLAILVAASFFNVAEIQDFIKHYADTLLGSEVLAQEEEIINRITVNISGGIFSVGLFGLISLIVASSFIFLAFQDALNVIWHRPVKSGLKKSIRRYVMSYLIVLATGTLLLLSLTIHSVTGFIEALTPGDIYLFEFLGGVFASGSSWLLGVVLLALLQRFLIYKKINWHYLLIGSAITSIMLTVGTILLGVYFNKFAATSLTGALGTIVVGLVWIYYEAQIILAGGQLTKVMYQKKYLDDF